MDAQQFHLLSQRMFGARFNYYKTMTINEINYCAHLRLIYISDFMIIVFTGFLACPLPSYRHREMRLSSVDSIRFWAQTTFDLLWWWGRITTPYFIRNRMTIFYLWFQKKHFSFAPSFSSFISVCCWFYQKPKRNVMKDKAVEDDGRFRFAHISVHPHCACARARQTRHIVCIGRFSQWMANTQHCNFVDFVLSGEFLAFRSFPLSSV